MPTLVELATQIVTAQATASALSTDEVVTALTRVHATLGQLESGVNRIGAAAVPAGVPAVLAPEATAPLNLDKIFKKNEVICLICGKGFKTLGRHLISNHGMEPKEYRRRFNLPKHQPLMAKKHAESMKERALTNEGLRNASNNRAGSGVAQRTAVKAPSMAKTDSTVNAEHQVKAPLEVPRAPIEAKKKVGRPRKVAAPAVP